MPFLDEIFIPTYKETVVNTLGTGNKMWESFKRN